MLTIGQLAAYAGVTVRAVRHYHQIGLLPEPERDASGYRRYGGRAAVTLIKIRTLANAGVPLSEIGRLLQADASTFAGTVQRIDSRLCEEIERLETSRKEIAQLAAGDSLALPPEVITYLDRLREIGASERMVEAERDAWILVAARWPDHLGELMTGKHAQLDDPQLVRLYRLGSEILESDAADAADDPRLEEVADILAGLLERASASGEISLGEMTHDDLPFDLLHALAAESAPGMQRLMDLVRQRGWSSWIRPERAEPPG
jgi:DNA-binding transcriptional MerR regulator